jgi:hypothetical protein
MNTFGKVFATALIWTAYLGVMLGFLLSDATLNMGGGNVVAVVAIMSIAAVLGTAAVNQQPDEKHHQEAEQKKLKRTEQSRIERLMQMMDEDDVVELEQILKEREVGAIRRVDS